MTPEIPIKKGSMMAIAWIKRILPYIVNQLK